MKTKVKKGRALILIGAFLAMITAPVLVFGVLTGGSGLGLSEFQEALVGQPSLIIFHSQTCPACEADKPMLQELYQQAGDQIRFLMVLVDDPKNKAIVAHYKVNAVPTYILTDVQGEEQKRIKGTIKQILPEGE